ncbi:MAG: dihydrofolate reductase [Arachnia sp.]
MRIVAIAAVADNGVIGAGSDMVWNIPEDFKRFKAVTTGNTLIMGRRTHEGIGRTLPDRRIIVVTRDQDWDDDGVEVAHSIEDALELAAETPEKICWIGGGGEIYRAAWPYLTALDITHVHQSPEGNVHFPLISRNQWTEVSREPRSGFDFVSYLPTPTQVEGVRAF